MKKKYFSTKNFFSNFKNSGSFQSGPAHFQNIMNLKKLKKWKFSHKEARNPNSDQYKFLRMILENTEAFRIKFMSSSKSWIQVFKNSLSRPRAGPRPMRRPMAENGPAQWVFENLNSAFGIAHTFDSKRFFVFKYHF